MYSVTSNAVANALSNLGKNITTLCNATSMQVEYSLSSSVTNFKWIAVLIANDESPASVAMRLYPANLITSSLLYHDECRFNSTYYLSLRYRFDTLSSFRVIAKDGAWTFKYATVYGIN